MGGAEIFFGQPPPLWGGAEKILGFGPPQDGGGKSEVSLFSNILGGKFSPIDFWSLSAKVVGGELFWAAPPTVGGDVHL